MWGYDSGRAFRSRIGRVLGCGTRIGLVLALGRQGLDAVATAYFVDLRTTLRELRVRDRLPGTPATRFRLARGCISRNASEEV